MRRLLSLLVCLLIPNMSVGAPGDITTEIQAPGRTCTGLTWDGKHLWVADHGLDQIMAVDPNNATVLKRFVSPGFRPAGLAFDGQQLWHADEKEPKLYRLRPEDGMTTRVIDSPVSEPNALAFDGVALWLSDTQGKTLHRVDPTDGTTISEVPFPSLSVDGLAYDGKYLWASDRLRDELMALEPTNGEVLVRLASPGPHPKGLAVVKNTLCVVDYQTDKITCLKMDDKEHQVISDKRDAWVTFTEQIHNFGPDVMPTTDIFIALPKNRNTQTLLTKPVFSKTATEIVSDQWGQKVARFRHNNLQAGQSAKVEMNLHLSTWQVQHVVYPHKVQSLAKIPRKIKKRYLQDAPKYDMQHPVIQQAVKEAVGKQQNPYWIVRQIYAYIHKHMHYEMVGGWDVAPKVLSRGSGSCSEYSYVFISMCRAAGVPARYVGSLVIRKDDASYDDVFHRWVEVYLPPYGWIPIDPSRGDKDTQIERSESFGTLTNDFLITTVSGGGSQWLGWGYNATNQYTCKGRCLAKFERIAEWSPEDPTSARSHSSRSSQSDKRKKAFFRPTADSCQNP